MILICDDDTTVRTSLTLVLKRAGYEVATAANQQEAIDFVRHTCPQLILMDMNYSNTTTGEEGLELLAKVRVFCPAVPVILITAWVPSTSLSKAYVPVLSILSRNRGTTWLC